MNKHDRETQALALQIHKLLRLYGQALPVAAITKKLRCEHSQALAAVELLERDGIARLQVLAADPAQERLTGVAVRAVAYVQEVAE